MLDKAKITIDGKITVTALILLGTAESMHLLQGASPRITWTLYASDGSVVSYEHFQPPFLLAVDEVFSRIRNVKYRFLSDGQTLFPAELDQYDPNLIRELLHNCIAHQDYSMQGRINVEEFEDKLVFVNEGSFIPGSIEQAMRSGYKPPYYRNPFLCDAMVQMDMIDTIAMGIPMIFRIQRNRYFPLPTYDLSNPNRVVVELYGKSIDEGYSRLLRARPELDLGVVFLLDKVQKHEEVTKEQAAELHDLKLIEGRYPRLMIAASVAADLGSEARYVRSKGLNDAACKELILQMLRDAGPVPRGKLVDMLDDLLPADMDSARKAKKVSNLLAAMKREKTIESSGVGKTSLWMIAPTR